MGDNKEGIYRKYDVSRTDGSSDEGGKHEYCEYFVLDWRHDPFAIPAALAYAEACKKEFPRLSSDLRHKAGQWAEWRRDASPIPSQPAPSPRRRARKGGK